MNNIISYTRNWGTTVIKWSLAVDQNMGPHNGGCGTCTGLITVHNGDSRSGQVDYTIEYYDTGQLTKFVKPGAFRIDSTTNDQRARTSPGRTRTARRRWSPTTARRAAQSVKVVWGNESFTYSMPAATSATFTWSGTQGSGGGGGTAHRRDHRLRRQVRRRRSAQHAPTAPRSSSTRATAPPRRPGRSAPTAPSGRSASAWTWPRPAPPTARRCSSTTATAPAPRSGRPPVRS